MTVPLERNEAHAARLALCQSQRERVEYLCEALANPSSSEVLDLLELYGYLPNRDRQKRNVYTLVSNWRKAHKLSDTSGTLPVMTTEMLDVLDERAANTQQAIAPAPRPLSVVRGESDEHVNTPVASTNTTTNMGTNTGTNINEHDHEHGDEHTNTPVREQVEPVREHANTVTNTTNISTVAPGPAVSAGPSGVMPASARPVLGSGSAPESARRLSKLGRAGAYLVSLVALGVSAEASLKFFADVFKVPDPARYFLFGVMELGLVVCGVLMAAGVRSERGTPGPARLLAWGLCVFAVVACIDLYGVLDGPLRAILGPIMSMVFLHLALGMEFREHHSGGRTGTLARVGREVRERVLSRLGLGDDSRDALTRTRDRAAVRFADLSAKPVVLFRTARLRRAAKAANMGADPAMQARARREHEILSNVTGLREVKHENPW